MIRKTVIETKAVFECRVKKLKKLGIQGLHYIKGYHRLKIIKKYINGF